MTVAALTAARLDPADLISAVADPEHGGLATFLGMTRRESGRRAFAAISTAARLS